jgi:hypothetical protein
MSTFLFYGLVNDEEVVAKVNGSDNLNEFVFANDLSEIFVYSQTGDGETATRLKKSEVVWTRVEVTV